MLYSSLDTNELGIEICLYIRAKIKFRYQVGQLVIYLCKSCRHISTIRPLCMVALWTRSYSTMQQITKLYKWYRSVSNSYALQVYFIIYTLEFFLRRSHCVVLSFVSMVWYDFLYDKSRLWYTFSCHYDREQKGGTCTNMNGGIYFSFFSCCRLYGFQKDNITRLYLKMLS